MKEKNITYHLPEGAFSGTARFYDNSDRLLLGSIYRIWNTYSELLKGLDGRRALFPGILSEPCLCLELGNVVKKINVNGAGAATSFDCYSIVDKERIQVKASSSKSGPSSFGPKSVFDRLYFLDFYDDDNYNGFYKIYDCGLNSDTIRDIQINSTETFGQQADKGRRPRFDIRKFIEDQKIPQSNTGYLLE